MVVTAMSDQTARNNLKGLLGRETVVKTERGGKAANALSPRSGDDGNEILPVEGR